MNSLGLLDYIGYSKRMTLEELKEKLDSIRKDMGLIRNIEISEEVKKLILKELEAKIQEIKEQMHDLIDLL